MSEHFSLDADQLRALSARYPGVKFKQVDASIYSLRLSKDDCVPEDRAWFVVSGAEDALIRHRFMLPEWTSLPPCGVRRHRKDKFGLADVHRNKTGYRLSGTYDDWLERLAAALAMPLLERFRRPPETSP